MNAEPAQLGRRLCIPLTETERLHRICELLSKAVAMDRASQAITPSNDAPKPTPETADSRGDRRVFNYIALIGEASPGPMRDTLGIERMTLYRTLRRLQDAGLIEVTGNTRNTTYRLSRAEAAKTTLN